MSDQPQFRTRVLPMPKVGDEIEIYFATSGGFVSQVEEEEGRFFVPIGEYVGVWLTIYGNEEWNWADPAVEALRLQEAAWRADTSPLPDWLAENTKYAEDVEEVICNIVSDCMTTCGCYERGDRVDAHKAIKAIAEAIPHLLRWQAQQEGGKP